MLLNLPIIISKVKSPTFSIFRQSKSRSRFMRYECEEMWKFWKAKLLKLNSNYESTTRINTFQKQHFKKTKTASFEQRRFSSSNWSRHLLISLPNLQNKWRLLVFFSTGVKVSLSATWVSQNFSKNVTTFSEHEKKKQLVWTRSIWDSFWCQKLHARGTFHSSLSAVRLCRFDFKDFFFASKLEGCKKMHRTATEMHQVHWLNQPKRNNDCLGQNEWNAITSCHSLVKFRTEHLKLTFLRID